MGFNEMGQSAFGMAIIGIAFLVVFGGFQNQGLYEEFLPNGVTGPNDINGYEASISISSQGIPYGTTSTTPTQDNNPLFNFVSEDIPQFLNAFATTAVSIVDAINFIGLPREITYLIAVFFGSVMSLFLLYFAVSTAAGFGLFKIGGS